MNSSETLLVNWISRRNMLTLLSLSALAPTVSGAVESITSRESSTLKLKHQQKPERKEAAQSRGMNVWKSALIVTALLWLDAETRDAICRAMDDFFETYIVSPLSREYGNTMNGTLKMLVPIFALAMISGLFSIKSGNASQEYHEEVMKELWIAPSFWEEIWSGSVEAPFIEEGLFRMTLPFILKKFFNQEVAQYYSSLVFWFVHNLRSNWTFDTKTFPAPIILYWFFLFYLKESRDVSHSMVAHSFHNTLMTTVRHFIWFKQS